MGEADPRNPVNWCAREDGKITRGESLSAVLGLGLLARSAHPSPEEAAPTSENATVCRWYGSVNQFVTTSLFASNLRLSVTLTRLELRRTPEHCGEGAGSPLCDFGRRTRVTAGLGSASSAPERPSERMSAPPIVAGLDSGTTSK